MPATPNVDDKLGNSGVRDGKPAYSEEHGGIVLLLDGSPPTGSLIAYERCDVTRTVRGIESRRIVSSK